MAKTSIHPLILLSLTISSAAMGLFSYQNYVENQMGYTAIFLLLCFLMITLAVYGFVRNGKINK
ncbi:hypothetical protein GJU40_18550 [Bacillus lacus]|uniref:Uncharacterized protein n=1 Tax=Metabacillus lacus TaxID=1983721 RepID=A0A7X2J2D2_9BACI|nr:hypothetical protein [Metabacillus lacus]MRX74125.1 hypothetical protein [Metabacillus lacus]